MDRNEFEKNFNEFLSKAMAFSEKARREGLLGLEDEIDEEACYKREIFNYGLRFVVDGTDAAVIKEIIENIINQDKDELSKRFKEIQLEALLSIQAGENTRILYEKIYSYNENYVPLSDD
jgi:chemotaxis protein MotA